MAQHSGIARSAIMTNAVAPEPSRSTENNKPNGSASSESSANGASDGSDNKDATLMPPPKYPAGRASNTGLPTEHNRRASKDGVGVALSDSPMSTAPSSPQVSASTASTQPSTPNRVRATTLDIPGLTKSKVSPDGRISQRDLGAKLVIIMVGLPARGKSYVTKKLSRYLNWLQHDTKIFNVGERRRVAAGKSPSPAKFAPVDKRKSSVHNDLVDSVRRLSVSVGTLNGPATQQEEKSASEKADNEKKTDDENTDIDSGLPPSVVPTKILVNGQEQDSSSQMQGGSTVMPSIDAEQSADQEQAVEEGSPEGMDQTANFFDPQNQRAVKMREQVALDTLDELLDYVLEDGGSVGILDATNSTMERRKAIIDHIRARAGLELGVLFLESSCVDQELLEANMRLKLSGPDYKGQDPTQALDDFKRRIALYEKSYIPLGEYEERNDMAYIQMIDVGRKVVSHQTNGFLSSQVVYYLLNFNLSPRQIWITRHGESTDNQLGRIGGDSELSENGKRSGRALARFIDHQRRQWEIYQRQKDLMRHLPPRPGDSTPPNPSYVPRDRPRNFCVWSSMMQRAVQTVEPFNEDEYDVKQMKMLDELHAGEMEGMTYDEIRQKFPEEYAQRKQNKLFYRYPGPGGEGYLDVINRLRAVIIEAERTTDHVLMVTHRSVARVLLAYFRGLKRNEVADLDVPLGMLYMLEPKPYGVDFRAYRYNPETEWFDYMPDYEMRQATY